MLLFLQKTIYIVSILLVIGFAAFLLYSAKLDQHNFLTIKLARKLKEKLF